MAAFFVALGGASPAVIGLLALVLVLLVFLAAAAATRNYVHTSRYGATKARFVYRATAGYLGLLVAFAFALALTPDARGWLLAGAGIVLLTGALVAAARVWLRFRHRLSTPPADQGRRS